MPRARAGTGYSVDAHVECVPLPDPGMRPSADSQGGTSVHNEERADRVVGRPLMKYRTSWAMTVACALVCLTLGAACIEGLVVGRGGEASDVESAWIVDPTDNVCGLSDPRMLSRPARVDHPLLLAATPEMKRIANEGIDPNSPLGVMLRQQAVDRVLRAADHVRQRDGYCSVWKRIRHRDGRAIPDVTDPVRQRL